MSRRSRSGATPKPIARATHVTLVRAAAKHDPRVAAGLVGIAAGRLDKQALLEILEHHERLLSVALHALRDAAGAQPVDDIVKQAEDPVETAEELVRREFQRLTDDGV